MEKLVYEIALVLQTNEEDGGLQFLLDKDRELPIRLYSTEPITKIVDECILHPPEWGFIEPFTFISLNHCIYLVYIFKIYGNYKTRNGAGWFSSYKDLSLLDETIVKRGILSV